MPQLVFGISNLSIDPSEYRDGLAASVKNCYRTTLGPDEHYVKWPGLQVFADSSSSNPVQGQYKTFSGVVLVVIGGTVYEVSIDGTLTAYSGERLDKDNPCVFTEDVSDVYVAHGHKPARINTGTKEVTILSGNAPDGVTHIAFARGYLLCNGLVSGGVSGDTNYSDDFEAGYSAVDSWEVFNNESLPDGCNAIATGYGNEVYSFGPDSVEPSYDDGTTPWTPIQGGYIQYGCIAPYSLVKGFDSFFWLSQVDEVKRIVRMVQGSIQPISGPYDRVIDGLTVFEDARSWIQKIDGFAFYVITFPTEDVTFAYMLATGELCEIGYYNPATADYEAYQGVNALYIKEWNKTLVGDRSSGLIYEQAGTNNNGDPIRMEVTSGHNESGTKKEKKERMLYFRTQQGYGGSFEYRTRDDNGPWRNEKTVPLATAATKSYNKVKSAGKFRSRQYQIIHSLDTPFIFMAADNDIELTGR
jgi:hypothetical protein